MGLPFPVGILTAMTSPYEVTVSADDRGIVVSVDGRPSAELGRQLRDIRAAAAKCGIQLRVDLTTTPCPDPR